VENVVNLQFQVDNARQMLSDTYERGKKDGKQKASSSLGARGIRGEQTFLEMFFGFNLPNSAGI